MSDRIRSFPGKLGIQQRVLPTYRADFFELLAQACEGGLSIFSGEVHADESIPTIEHLNLAVYAPARNYQLFDVQSPYYLLWQAGIMHWLQDWNPDVLIVEANPRYLSNRRGIQWMHARQKPVIGWGLGAPPVKGGPSGWGKILAGWRVRSRKRFLNQLDAVIAYSHNGAQEYRNSTFPPIKTFVAANAVARRPAGPVPHRSPDFDGRPKVMFVGRLQFRKRIDNLLYACAALPQALQPQLWIVGDGPARGELQALANQIYPSAEFAGEKKGSELEAFFKRADLFVLPGTGGLAVQEAMAYGLPVIVAEGDGTQNDLVKSGNGWLIPSNDEKALLETLREALSDPKRLRKMGAASFQVVQEEVNVEQMVAVFVQAATSIMSAGISHL